MKGGGTFIYCELLDNASSLIDAIVNASTDEILALKDKVYSDHRINGYISKSELEQTHDIFNQLTHNEQKQALIQLIDKNQLYVNYCDIDDEEYQVSDKDKSFSNSFYGEH